MSWLAAWQGLVGRNRDAGYAFLGRIDIDGFDHPRGIFDLTESLMRRGYSDNNIEKVRGGNFRRPLGEIWG